MERLTHIGSLEGTHPFTTIQPKAQQFYEHGVPPLPEDQRIDLLRAYPHFSDPKFLESWKNYKEEVNTWSAILIDRIYSRADRSRPLRNPFGLIEPDPTSPTNSRILTEFPSVNPYGAVAKAFKRTLSEATEEELLFLKNAGRSENEEFRSARQALLNLQQVLSFGGRTMKSQHEDPIRFIKNGVDTAAEVFGDFAGLVPEVYRKQYGTNPTASEAKEILSSSFLQIRDLALMHFSLFVATYQKLRFDHQERLSSFDIAEIGRIRYLKLNERGQLVSGRLHEEMKARVIRGDMTTGCPAMVNLHGKDGSVMKQLHDWVSEVSGTIYSQTLPREYQTSMSMAAD